MATYIAKTGLDNDLTGAHFEPGAVVTDADFPQSVIENWLALEILVPEAPEVPEVAEAPAVPEAPLAKRKQRGTS